MQNKKPYNDKGQKHGLWELYNENRTRWFIGIFKNGEQIGLWIWGNNDGSIKQIIFYANE